MANKILLTLSQYLVMSETHIKNLVAQGLEIVIVDNANPTVNTVEAPVATPAYQHKVDNSSNNVGKTTKKPAKADSKKSSTAKADNKPTISYGNVKANDYFKVINKSTNKVIAVGKAKSVSKADKIVTTKGGKKISLDNCVAINRPTYNKLKKSLKANEVKTEKKSSSSRLTPTDYKVVYAAYLEKQGKITADEVAKAKDSAEYRAELYHQFSKELPLTNAEALKLFAELSDKTATANAEPTDNANANA